MPTRWNMLIFIAISELCALSMWFSVSSIAPALIADLHVAMINVTWIAVATQIGFIIGAFLSAYFAISDRLRVRHLFIYSAFLAAGLNLLIIFSSSILFDLLLRFLVGVFLAGIYPTAVKMVSQWFSSKRGVSIGVLVGALTLGSATPHFFVSMSPTVHWRIVIILCTALGVLAALVMSLFVQDAPELPSSSGVSFRYLKQVMQNRQVMLANFGYFGHMWELYAMWTWIPLFLYHSLLGNSALAAIWSFLVIGVAGAVGCVFGGIFSDRIGRSKLTIAAMVTSAACSLSIGYTYHQAIWLTGTVALLWGMSIIADSAQFSAAVADFAKREYAGTALAFQMSIGFLITTLSIYLIPVIQKWMGWEHVFMILSLGPLVGILSMWKFGESERGHVIASQ